jgi:hypothetical protein
MWQTRDRRNPLDEELEAAKQVLLLRREELIRNELADLLSVPPEQLPSQMGTYRRLREHVYHHDNLTYLTCAAFGAIAVFGVLASVIYLLRRKKRLAFQAIMSPVGVSALFVPWCVVGFVPVTESAARVFLLLLFVGGVAFIPYVVVKILRSLNWPEV